MPNPAESTTAPLDSRVPAGPNVPLHWTVFLFAVGLLGVWSTAAPIPARAADSLSVRAEIGIAAEASNEQFYESSIDDTTFLGRQLYSTPELRIAVVALAELFRASLDGRWSMQFIPSASIGEKATRLGATGSFSGRPTDLVRYSLEPRFEYQRDESFGMYRRDWRASVVGRVRRLSLDELGVLRLSAGAEVVRTLESSDPIVLSGTSVRAALGYSRNPLFGPEWDVEYGPIVRTYRDSTSRDHIEQRLALSLRKGFTWGNAVSLLVDAVRRDALREVESSRDRFTQVHALADAGAGLWTEWTLRPELRAEVMRYDEPDSIVDFDYQLFGAELALRRELGPAWRVSTGPRFELLAAPLCPWEEYRELAWAFEVEKLTPSAWWDLAPAAGHRSYAVFDESPALTNPLTPILHSSFDFVEVAGFLDQQLPGGLRARALGTVRAERHADRNDDALSLYFSLDVRRLF